MKSLQVGVLPLMCNQWYLEIWVMIVQLVLHLHVTHQLAKTTSTVNIWLMHKVKMWLLVSERLNH